MSESSRSRDVRDEPNVEIESSDCVVIGIHSVCNGRVTRRMLGSTAMGEDTGKLSSGKFEIHLEYDPLVFLY